MMTLEQIEKKIERTVEMLGMYPHSNAISNELDRLYEMKYEILADMGLLEEEV